MGAGNKKSQFWSNDTNKVEEISPNVRINNDSDEKDSDDESDMEL